MMNIANSVNTVSITSDTVSDVVGICYFDPITEALIEISDMQNHFFTVEPLRKVLRKYYLVVSPGNSLLYAKVRVSGDELDGLYSIKTILSDMTPTAEQFSMLQDFNSFRVDNPRPGDFIPMHILIESRTPINEVLNMDIEIEYDT